MSTTAKTAYPDGIEARHVREAPAWRRHASPLALVVFGAVLLLGLLGVLGHERDWRAQADGTAISVHMPEVIRNGEFLEMRVTIEAQEAIGELGIGVDQALWEDLTVNTMIPAATEETSADGAYRFTFGELAAGSRFDLKIDAQVNPDIVGGNEGRITVYDGDVPLVSLPLQMAVLP
jgi:hypothetical protein